MCMHACLHTYINTYTHTYIHTYIHTAMHEHLYVCVTSLSIYQFLACSFQLPTTHIWDVLSIWNINSAPVLMTAAPSSQGVVDLQLLRTCRGLIQQRLTHRACTVHPVSSSELRGSLPQKHAETALSDLGRSCVDACKTGGLY